MKKTRIYTTEFKQQAVQLAEDLGSVSEAGRRLGISKVNIYTWKNKKPAGPVVAGRKAEVTPVELEKECQRLQQENAQLKKVNHILKAAAAFFSQDHLK